MEPTLSIYLHDNRYDHLNLPEAEIIVAQSAYKHAVLKFLDVTGSLSRTEAAGHVMKGEILNADVGSFMI